MSNISLYDITEEFNALESMLLEDGGELSESSEQLEAYVGELIKTKTDNMVSFIQKLEDEAELADMHIKRLQQYKKVRENAKARLENYALMCLDNMNQDSVQGSMFEIKKVKPRKVVNITDESKIPVEFAVAETIVKIEKKKIMDAFKAGQEVPGAEIVDGKRSVSFKLKKVK